jgi:hypothetical protein
VVDRDPTSPPYATARTSRDGSCAVVADLDSGSSSASANSSRAPASWCRAAVQIALQPPPLGVGRRDHARDRDRGRHRGGAAVLSDDPGPLAAGLGDPLAASLGEHQHPAQDEQRAQDGNRAEALARMITPRVAAVSGSASVRVATDGAGSFSSPWANRTYASAAGMSPR